MINIEVNANGSITLYGIRKGIFCKKTYYGYTKRQAVTDFRHLYPAR